ncbi:MAG: hypothetical protein HHAS10_12200 [Candidatus Altimarinota bacterium]
MRSSNKSFLQVYQLHEIYGKMLRIVKVYQMLRKTKVRPIKDSRKGSSGRT